MKERQGPVVSKAAGFLENYVIKGIAVSSAELRHFCPGFKWIRPSCPCGSEKNWGHGFVTRIIDENVVELKRFRCPIPEGLTTRVPPPKPNAWRNFSKRHDSVGAI